MVDLNQSQSNNSTINSYDASGNNYSSCLENSGFTELGGVQSIFGNSLDAEILMCNTESLCEIDQSSLLQ